MSEPINLEEKFPDMRPVKSAPGLFTMNGFGLMVLGNRDHDAETGTYVKTHVVSALFVPVFAIGAYRVADADRGWYFLGKVPLSALAKTWNVFVLVLVLSLAGFGWWRAHTRSAEYLAGQKLAEADALVQANQPGQAASLYLDVIKSNTKHTVTARAQLTKLVDDAPNQPAAEAAGVLRAAAKLRPPLDIPSTFVKGLEAAEKHAATQPMAALAIVDAVAPLATDADALAALRRQLLEQEIGRNPTNIDAVSMLAEVYEQQQQFELCEKLLTPQRNQLGTREGARILGQILARQDQFDQAYPLLQAYSAEHLKKLHAAEAKLETSLTSAHDRAIAELRAGTAAGFDFKRHESAGQAAQDTMVQNYLVKRLKEDADCQQAREEIAAVSKVVPVALDLGIVLLRRGQGLADPAQRKAELERAEKTFLSVRGQAGQTDQYRAFLGQVYYWLGKQDEGKKLFDELLAANQRQFETLIVVCRMLREVGAVSEARTLAEEAHDREADQAKKYQAARLRALLFLDLKDEIDWLKKSNPKDEHVKASLAYSLGNQALVDGRDAEAAQQLRLAIEIYSRLPADQSATNNQALAYMSLYSVSGDPADLTKSAELLEKAMALDPRDSIVIRNAADSMLQAASRDLVGQAIDLKTLKMQAHLGLLAYLYGDRAGRDQWIGRIRKHSPLTKAMSYYERLIILAPKGPTVYSTLADIHEFSRNTEALRGVLQRLQEAQPDLTDYRRASLDYYAGKDEPRQKQEREASLERARALLASVRQSGSKGPTLALAIGNLTSRLTYGNDDTVDASEVVKLAEEAHAVAPSRATTWGLQDALLFRADRTLDKQDAGYHAIVDQTRRSLNASHRLAIALDQDASLRGLVLANADFQRAMTLLQSEWAKYPDQPSPWMWAVCRHTDPALASQIAEALQADEIGKLERAIEHLTAPLSGRAAYREYWFQQLSGQPAKGLEILKQYADQGVPLWLPAK